MNHKTIDRDTIIEEIHQTRRRMADQFGGDIDAILEDARKRQAASGRAIWHGSVLHKPVNQTGTKPTV
jgi:hypothetical protein